MCYLVTEHQISLCARPSLSEPWPRGVQALTLVLVAGSSHSPPSGSLVSDSDPLWGLHCPFSPLKLMEISTRPPRPSLNANPSLTTLGSFQVRA